jgi:malate synthase
VGEKSSELQEIVNRASDAERNFLEKLDLLKNGQIAPTEISVQDLTIENLFSDKAWEDLFEVPQGAITEEGLRYAIYMSSEYMFQQLNGNNAAAIDDYLSGTRLMNDFATYEIFWHWLWTTLHHQVELTQNGETTKQRDRVTKKLMHRLLDERREDVTKYFAEQDKQGIVSRFDRSKAPLVMDLLQTQIFHPEWIMYGSRILLSIIESEREQQQIIEAVFSMKREELVGKVETGELSKTVLSSYDYVYDTSKFTSHNL